MKIGALANATGISRDTIRFYERNGLIVSEPGKEKTNSYREYPDELVLWLGFIQRARDAGMPVADIGKLIVALGSGCDPAYARRVLGAKIEELENSVMQIEQVIDFLKAQLAKL